MAREDLLLAPEGLEALRTALGGLVPALGPEHRGRLAAIGTTLDLAIAARADGDTARALESVIQAIRQLAELGDVLGGSEGQMMRAVAARFEGALARGDGADAAQMVDTMRERSGARRRRDTVPDL